MSVHYKFKSTLDYDTITFDGLHISVADLKKAILQQKRLSKITDFDLQIINAQTKEEYQHESSLIPKNTSLIISRVPVANQAKKSWDTSSRTVQPKIVSKVESTDLDLSKMEGSEEDKIQAMMLQSTAEYDPKSYQKIRGYSQTGEVPATYRCNKCKKGGHWIKNCPYTISKEHAVEKRTTGIPKSFRDKDDRAPMVDSQDTSVEEDKNEEIPDDLVCSICNDLFVDAVMIPCCGSSFCDDCVRTALLESEDNECPDCKEKGSSPGSLIPNRFLRNSVNSFKNRTGYKATSQAKKEVIQPPHEEPEKKESEALIAKETNDVKEEEKNESESESKEKLDVDDKTVTTASQPVVQPKDDMKDEDVDVKHNKTANTTNSPAHDDSDYEDNIVVTVPSASDTRTEKYLSRRHASHPKPPGIEQSSPKSKHQVSPYQESSSYKSNEHHSHSAKEWEHSSEEKGREIKENVNNEHFLYEKNRTMSSSKPMQDSVQPPGANPIPVPVYPHQPYDMQQQRPIRPINMHPGYHNHMHRPPLYSHPNMPPHHPPHQMRLPMPPINSYESAYNPIGSVAPGYQRFPSAMPNRFNYPIRDAEAANQMRPYNNIASVYEEVAAKVGVGIIDDPLEAFNRIMKEKEKKKDERRSPDRRRRSKDRHIRGNFRTSPYNPRTKDHGYYDKRGRSRERDNDRRWPRYGKGIDKERERERDRDRDREREREREKDQGYRTRRSKSLDRSSRSRSHSPPNKRYRSPQTTKGHSVHEKHQHQHHYHIPKFRNDDQQEDIYERQRRDCGRSMATSSKSLDSRGENRQQADHDDKNTELRRSYNINDENSEPPPPGFEVQSSRNPFHTNNNSSFPPSVRERDRPLRNNTPDLYEKCVSQDMEENKAYNIGSKTDTQRSKSRSATRSRSLSHSSIRASEKRRKIHRSTTPKGKPSDGRLKRDKDNILIGRSHSHTKQKSEERQSKKDKEMSEHESKRRSLTPPRQKDSLSDQHQTSSETDHKEKSDSKRLDKKLKDRKKKRREKGERKKVKKEKKSKKERHRPKSEEKDCSKDVEKDKLASNSNSVENNLENILEVDSKNLKEELGECVSMEKELVTRSSPKNEQNGSLTAQIEITPRNQQSTEENDEKTPTSSDIKCFEAVLDIHEYETDFDDNSFKLQDNSNKLVPGASKWELEDQVSAVTQSGADKLEGAQMHNITDNKVTSDVIVRAEKAIFARAINAIRPIEVRTKSVSKERSSKCFTDDHESIRNIQITLPVNISKDRSIEVKTESHEKKKSIKERLGSKVSQPIYSQVADSRRDSDHSYKSNFVASDRNLESDRSRDRDRDRRRKCSTDNKDSSKKVESDKNYRDRQGRDTDRSHERERDRVRGRDKEHVRYREKEVFDQDRNRNDDDKNRERARDRHGTASESDRGRRHSKSKDYKTSKIDKSHYSFEHRDYENSSTVQKKRSISSTNSDSDEEDHKRKLSKSDKKSRKRSESPDSDGGKRSNRKKNKSDKKKKKKSKK